MPSREKLTEFITWCVRHFLGDENGRAQIFLDRLFQVGSTEVALGFSAKRNVLAQLLALNPEVAAKIEKGEPVTAPGVPKNYPEPKKLVTVACIKPGD